MHPNHDTKAVNERPASTDRKQGTTAAKTTPGGTVDRPAGALGGPDDGSRGLGSKTITTPSGAIVVTPPLPTRTVTRPGQGCDRVLAEQLVNGSVVRRTVFAPPAPGIRAAQDGESTIRVTVKFGAFTSRCKPAVVLVTLDANSDGNPGITRDFPVRDRTMELRLTVPKFFPASPDVVHASAYTKQGHRSDTVHVLIK